VLGTACFENVTRWTEKNNKIWKKTNIN